MAFDSRESLISTPMDQFEETKLLPDGTYFGTIVRHEWGSVGERDTSVLDYYCQLTEAGEDTVSKVNGIDLSEYEMRVRFFITRRAMFRLRQFHASLGFDESLPADAVIPETTGMKVLLTVT